MNELVILEDNPTTTNYLKQLLKTLYPTDKVVTFDTVSTAKAWFSNNVPRIALIDIGMPDESGLNFLKEIKRHSGPITAVIVTVFGDDESLFQALSLGADGYILKEEDESAMIRILARIKEGEPPLSPAIALKMMKHFQNASKNSTGLSPRESETLKLISKGYSVPEVAIELGLSRQTVAGYVKTIYKKLHVSNRAQATREAIKRGLI